LNNKTSAGIPAREGRRFYDFGEFRLDADLRQLLSNDGRPLPLVSRAFEALLYLVQNAGELVNKADLMRAVWPDTVVEENNLSQSIAAIRRVLGERPGEYKYIVTVPGRGFRFVAAVSEPGGNSPGAAQSEAIAAAPVRSMRRRLLVIVMVALASVIGTLAYLAWPQPKSVARANTLAILPFKSVDPASKDSALPLGMTDTLITRLRQLEGISIQPFSSVRRFGGAEQDARAAGQLLGVAMVLDGTLQRDGDRLRVTATMIDVTSGQVLWSKQFHESFTDIFAVQDAIAARVTDALAVELSGAEHQRLTRRYTSDAEAYQLYVNGWFQRTRGDAESFKRSIGFFQQAIARDPNYPLPYVGLADSYAMLSVYGVMPRDLAFPPALDAVKKALALDGELGEAHATLGHIRVQYEGDYDGAEREYQRAVSLAPRYAIGHMWYGLLLAWEGRFDESLVKLRYAQELEPTFLTTSANIGMVLYYARRYDDAIAHLSKLLDTDPTMDHARSFLGRAYLRKGDYDAAIAEFKERKTPSVFSNQDLAIAYALAGREQEALAELERVLARAKTSYVSPYDIAAIYVSLGEKDTAFTWLARAASAKGNTLVDIDPVFDAVRHDPRMATMYPPKRNIGSGAAQTP
jgi:TolB-like protein/DNA-binding winged helix-turn-helix (wHTH) protein/tetratricopeptide (TPR) repeat protein